MLNIIKGQIQEIEQKENIKILYACESGSRAWGFPSKNSDYDVRFIYLKPTEWYLSIDDKRDSIDYPVNDLLDINGWDIRKALRLFRSSNSVVYEWIQSPIVYKTEGILHETLLRLMNEFYSLRAGMHHYLGMTMNTLTSDLMGDQVRVKKYLYALRSVLACKWIMTYNTVPPMEFAKLRQLIKEENELNRLIDQLLEQKLQGDEKFAISPVRLLNHFIQNEVRMAEMFSWDQSRLIDNTEKLDQLFRKLVNYNC